MSKLFDPDQVGSFFCGSGQVGTCRPTLGLENFSVKSQILYSFTFGSKKVSLGRIKKYQSQSWLAPNFLWIRTMIGLVQKTNVSHHLNIIPATLSIGINVITLKVFQLKQIFVLVWFALRIKVTISTGTSTTASTSTSTSTTSSIWSPSIVRAIRWSWSWSNRSLHCEEKLQRFPFWLCLCKIPGRMIHHLVDFGVKEDTSMEFLAYKMETE